MEELHEMIAKVHDDIEGRYDLDSYDKGIIHNLLCDLQSKDREMAKFIELLGKAKLVMENGNDWSERNEEEANKLYTEICNIIPNKK